MSLGIHIKAASFDRSLIASIIRARPDLVVVVGGARDLSILAEIHVALGDTCHYGFRAMEFEPWIEASMGIADAAETAAGWLDDISIMCAPGEADPAKRLAIVAQQYGYITFQCLNEQKGSKKWQSDFDIARIDLGIEHKIRMGVCGWGWGQPEPQEWATYDPTLRKVKSAGDYATLILHNYWGPGWLPDPNDRAIFMRPLDLRDYCYAHDLHQVWDKQVEYWEFGKDEPGWRAAGGPLPDKYIDQLEDADSYTAHIRKACYDCSLTPDDPGQPHWYSLQENYIVQKAKPGQPEIKVRPIDLLLEAIANAPKTLPRSITAPAPNPQPDPVPVPTPDPTPIPQPQVIAIANGTMETPRVFGHPAIPDGWGFEYRHAKKLVEVHSEMEQHPTHVKSGGQSARLWGVGSWIGWYYQVIDTVPGMIYTVMLDTLATVTDVVDAPSLGTVTQKVTLDPAAAIDPGGLGFSSITNSDTWSPLVYSAQATGPQMTIFYIVSNDNQRRADAFLDNVRVTAVPGQPVPAPDPLSFVPYPDPQVAIVTGAAGYWRLRSTPYLLDPATNEVGRLPNNHEFIVDGHTYDGQWYRDLSGAWAYSSKVKIRT